MTVAAVAPAPSTGDERVRRWRRDRVFYGAVTAGAILVVATGFGRSYYFRSFTGAPELSAGVRIHAALFTSWMVLFAAQASLVSARRTDLHRRLGVLGIGLAIALLIAGYATALTGARTGWAGPRVPRDAAAALPFLTIPFGDLILFAGFFGAAVYTRRQPDSHKRLMTLAMIGGIMPAALGRLPAAVGIGAALALLVAGPVYDRWSRGAVHRAYRWGVPIIVASIPLRLAVGSTEAWQRAARWLIQ